MPPRVPVIRLAPHTTPSTYHVLAQPLRPKPRQNPHYTKPTTPKRPFTSTSPIRAHEQNFYEILDLPTTASAAEIKKYTPHLQTPPTPYQQSNKNRQFYALSMRHHPDRNREDENASQRFARISAAYNVLGNASKRAVYDRDNGFHQIHASSSPGHTHSHPMGSHSSYAGSRPASGLSKRRSAFHGPPPSFYEQGGYGATGRQGDGFAAGKSGSSSGFGGAAGFGSGSAGASASGRYADPEDWEGFIRRNPLHHFNARGHFRTQAAEDKRRRERASAWRGNVSHAEWPEPVPGAGSGVSFTRFLVSLGCLVLAGVSAGLWPSPVPDQGKLVRQRRESSH